MSLQFYATVNVIVIVFLTLRKLSNIELLTSDAFVRRQLEHQDVEVDVIKSDTFVRRQLEHQDVEVDVIKSEWISKIHTQSLGQKRVLHFRKQERRRHKFKLGDDREKGH